MKKSDYLAYLQSEAWQIRRKWKLEQADHRCQVCNSDEQLHVHHRTYDRIGNERENDLTVLCRDCHALYHNRIDHSPPALPAEAAEEAWIYALGGGVHMHPEDREILREAHVDYFPADNVLQIGFENPYDMQAMAHDRRGVIPRMALFISRAVGHHVNVQITSWVW